MNSEKIRFLNKVEAVALKKNMEKWKSIDAVTVATMIWPEMIKRTLETHMSAVTGNDAPKGAVMIDLRSPSKNVEIVRDINVTDFQNKLVQYLA